VVLPTQPQKSLNAKGLKLYTLIAENTKEVVMSKKDENEVEEFLKSYNLTPERIKEAKLKEKMESPDFKVTSSQGDLFFCEVKSVLTNIDDSGLSHFKCLSIISEKIHKAVKQFNTVNPKRSYPNVLIWVTHTPHVDWHRFRNILQGGIKIPSSEDDKLIFDFRHLEPFKRIENELALIDLSIWLFNRRLRPFFSGKYMPFVALLSRIFDDLFKKSDEGFIFTFDVPI